MAAASGDFLAGEELDDLFFLLDGGFLDEDIQVNSDLDSLFLDESSSELLLCEIFSKSYKTQRGLTRHKTAKHQQQQTTQQQPSIKKASVTEEDALKKLHSLHLKVMLEKSAVKCSEDLCMPEEIRSKFKNFTITTDESYQLWLKFKSIIIEYKGDAEKFYSKFYGLLSDNLLPTKFTDDIACSNFLLMEVANLMLAHLSGNKSTTSSGSNDDGNFSDREISSIQYLAGYIIRKSFAKFKFNQKRSLYMEQCLSLMTACKADPDDKQTYVDMKDRGGLWKTNSDTQKIFTQCEKIFRKHTSTHVTSIDSKIIVNEMLSDIYIISSFKTIWFSAQLEVPKEIAFNLLESMLMLYTRIRSFSYARDVREKHRISKKQGKKSSLRTEIKKSSSSKELGD